MINVKDQVYAALCTVADNVTDLYPNDWQTMPAIQYTEEANTLYEKTAEGELSSYLRYRVDIWDNGSTSLTAIAVDEALSALGLNRIECSDQADPSQRRHKLMRYEGVIDNATQVVSWTGSR